MNSSKRMTLSGVSYIGVFLTLSCSLSCSYCLNRFSLLNSNRLSLNASQWLRFFNELELPENLPLTLQGGEPSEYQGFWSLLSGLRSDLKVDLLTNLSFDLKQFCGAAQRSNFERVAPYPSIRVSFHPEQMDLNETLRKIIHLSSEGWSVGLYMVDHPCEQETIKKVTEICAEKNIDFRLKDFLGMHKGKLYGNYKYDLALKKEKVFCKTSEILLSPEGNLHRCHRDLYQNENSLGSIEQGSTIELKGALLCQAYGQCHPCDVKIKNNRFQEFGHTSVEIGDDVKVGMNGKL